MTLLPAPSRLACVAALCLGAALPAWGQAAAPSSDAPALFKQHCAACHGEQRTGGMGPALLPESLERLRPAEAQRTIAQGRQATQMPGFSGTLSAEEIGALAQWVYQPVSPAPRWTEADIRASREAAAGAPDASAKPLWRADPMNLFVVVEGGYHHVSRLDGDLFEVIHRFASRYALHGGPKFTPDGRFVFFGSRDGWITKYDLWNLRVVAEVRAGLNMRNIAVSGDGRYVMAANYPPRKGFVVAMKDIPELWEISYDPQAAPIHDDKVGEAVAKPGHLGVRRTLLDEPLDDFFFDQSYRHVLGATRPKTDSGAATAQVVNLDIRRKVADLPLAGMPHLGSGITWAWKNTTVLASPNLKGSGVDVIDMATIATPGPGFFMRSHERSRYAWTDSMMSPTAKDTLTLIDKATLQAVATVREPGKTLAHIEFTKDGRHALASVWEMDGALIVYDAQTLKEVKRLPMSKPVGKYNVWNKISRSEGTSH